MTSTDDTLLGTSDGSAQTSGVRREALRRGDVVGRFVVVSPLGAGGMGIVHAAYDPELDRKVALKLLHAESGSHRSLLREAQAMAKLSHPNVVAIHDVGEHRGRVWLAMEFVEGTTLGEWCRGSARRWRDVLEVFVAAGRGLAAAHERGLVHRDFKPDNVMVGTDGRVRVMDFGLARSADAVASGDDGRAVASPGAPDAEATHDRGIVGTPAYMAPEQHVGHDVGPAADQFSFCVALWEALYGVRPFTGTGLAELATNVVAGKRQPAHSRARVPAWLRRACERGLLPESERRFPDMPALLATLQRGQSRARVRTLVAGAGVLAMLGAGGVAERRWQRARAIAACEAEGESITTVWNDDAGAAVRVALIGTGVGYAETTADKVTPWLDAQSEAWARARTQLCVDATVERREGWDADVESRATWCLDDRRLELHALVIELGSGEPGTVEKAVQAAASLPRVELCLERELLLRLPAVPADRRDEVQAVRAELSRATALHATGAYEQGLAVANHALADAQSVGSPALTAAIRTTLGELLDKTGRYADAEAMLEAAYFDAEDAGAADVSRHAAERLTYVVGYELARRADGLRWSRHAEARCAELPDPLQLNLAANLSNRGTVHLAARAYAEARPLLARAVELREHALGGDHYALSQLLNNLAAADQALGAHADARALHERALAIRLEALGPDHPEVAQSLSNLAGVYRAQGAHADARPLLERALKIFETALGHEHPLVAGGLNNLAAVRQAEGAYADAISLHERALAIRERVLGTNHPDVAQSLNNLAAAHEAAGAPAKAAPLFARALAIMESVLGSDQPRLAYPLLGLANTEIALGKPAEALAHAERAMRLWEAAGSTPYELAEARFAVAMALEGSGGDRSRAVALAEQAADGFRDAGKAGARGLVEVDAWLVRARTKPE